MDNEWTPEEKRNYYMSHELRRQRPGTREYANESMETLGLNTPAGLLSNMQIPLVSDAAGGALDLDMFMGDPESRTLGNMAASLAGLLPGIPALSASLRSVKGSAPANFTKYKKAKEAEKKKQQVEETLGETTAKGAAWEARIDAEFTKAHTDFPIDGYGLFNGNRAKIIKHLPMGESYRPELTVDMGKGPFKVYAEELEPFGQLR